MACQVKTWLRLPMLTCTTLDEIKGLLDRLEVEAHKRLEWQRSPGAMAAALAATAGNERLVAHRPWLILTER